MPYDDLEQIATQNDFHIIRTSALGAKRGSLRFVYRGSKWKLKHLFAMSRIMKKSNRRMTNVPNTKEPT